MNENSLTDLMQNNKAIASNKIREIWLAGGCFWGVEEYYKRIYGVVKTTVGYANGKTQNPTYQDIHNSGHAETVHITYDLSMVSLQTLLEYYFKIIDPTSINKQGNDIGTQYRTGIYYKDEQDNDIIKMFIAKEQKKHKAHIAIEVSKIENYYLAEDYHQDYLEKNPKGYCHVDFSVLKDYPQSKIDQYLYSKPSQTEIKEKLSENQFQITQQNGTEPPFSNEYWDNHRRGIYVDIVTGEPLFVSSDKFDSGCGWPSFSKPITEEVIIEKSDRSLSRVRTEVRSRAGDSHLGHVFTDGPKEMGGLRYCINSAAVKFIPYDEMESSGYAHLKELVK